MQRLVSSNTVGLVVCANMMSGVQKWNSPPIAATRFSTVLASSVVASGNASRPQLFAARMCSTASEDPIKTAILTFNTLRRMHAVEPHHDRRQRLQQQAWRTIQGISEEDIEKADNRGVATVLVSWAYFARFWENGRDGPASALPLGPSKDDILVEIDASSSIIHDPDRNKSQNAAKTREDVVEAPRQEVLDEVFE